MHAILILIRWKRMPSALLVVLCCFSSKGFLALLESRRLLVQDLAVTKKLLILPLQRRSLGQQAAAGRLNFSPLRF
ncbi:MAG TPA: hypothetical protein DCM05_02915 [Elusimicrobia bacterium]|nr:hypothetical protein [Elusimicrobiota bacterium]